MFLKLSKEKIYTLKIATVLFIRPCPSDNMRSYFCKYSLNLLKCIHVIQYKCRMYPIFNGAVKINGSSTGTHKNYSDTLISSGMSEDYVV